MFILYFDSKYFRWGPPLIESIQRHEPKEKVYIYGINLSDEQCNKLLRRYYNVIVCLHRLTIDKPTLPHEGAPPIRKQRAPRDELRFHIIARKARFILNVMGSFPKERMYTMLDVDMLVVNNLLEVKKQMVEEGYDFAGIEANPEKICGGFYMMRPTEATMGFLREWDDFLMEGELYWDKDQPSMSRIMRKHRNRGLRFLPASRLYLDHLSREEAFVWSAHKSEFGDKNQRFELYGETLNKQVAGKISCKENI